MNLDYLETIGKFVGTYGLAVFLVLYYAVKLYPETQKERAEWIRQITRLRQLVDPATRPLTRDQAKTVLQLASDSLADRLLLVLESSKRMGKWSSGSSSTGEVSITLFDQEFSYNPTTEMPQTERDQELDKIIKGIERALNDQMRRSRENLEEALKHVSEMGKRDAYRLALLRFGNTSLESVWQRAYEATTGQGSEGLTKILTPSDRYEMERVLRFVGDHPSSSPKVDAVEGLFAQVRYVSGQEHASKLKTAFDRHVEEELRKIDASEEDI